MGSTSFLGFSSPKLTCFFVFLTCSFSGSLVFFFSVPYFGLVCDHGNLTSKKEKVLDRGQNGFLM